jgi:small-conductance mechanosensitive channel
MGPRVPTRTAIPHAPEAWLVSLRAALPYALALFGLLKAGGVVWFGAHVGLSWWVVTPAAVAWAVLPPVAAAAWSRRARRRALARAGADALPH